MFKKYMEKYKAWLMEEHLVENRKLVQKFWQGIAIGMALLALLS